MGTLLRTPYLQLDDDAGEVLAALLPAVDGVDGVVKVLDVLRVQLQEGSELPHQVANLRGVIPGR